MEDGASDGEEDTHALEEDIADVDEEMYTHAWLTTRTGVVTT